MGAVNGLQAQEIMQIINSLLLGVATPGKLGSSSSQANFRFIRPFCFLLTVFHDTFSIAQKILPYYVYKYFPPRGQWMDYKSRLVRKFIHCFGAQRPRGKIGLSYSLVLWDFIFSCPLYLFPCSRISFYLLLFLCLISFLLFPCASFGKTLVHEFLISYSHTDMILDFFRQCNSSAHCVFGAKKLGIVLTS